MHQHTSSFFNLAILLLSTAICLLGWVAWRGGELALSLEHAPLAWLQCMILTASAVTAFHLWFLNPRNPVFWAFSAIALLFCALDEKFMFHEATQVFIYSHYLTPSAQAAFFIHAITLIYGLGGLFYLYCLRNKAQRTTFITCCFAVLIGLMAIGLDIAFDSVHIQAYEEVLEYLAETVFLIGLTHELQHQRVGQSPNSPA